MGKPRLGTLMNAGRQTKRTAPILPNVLFNFCGRLLRGDRPGKPAAMMCMATIFHRCHPRDCASASRFRNLSRGEAKQDEELTARETFAPR